MEGVAGVQQAVRQNAGEVQDYLRDLDNWTKQMEKKDEQLKQAKKKALSEETSKSREASPPKRSKKTEISKEKSDPEKHPNVIKMDTGPVKIKGSDYAAWDKFDVEAACEEVEKDIEEEVDEEEDEEVDDERKRVEAVAEKERGNAAFKAGKWDQAIERYTRGMQLDPSNCVLPANRAMALLKKSQYGAAEADCTLALSIDPTYVKALQRRASARTGLGKLSQAVTDYDEVLRLESGNKAAQAERSKLINRMKEKPKDENSKEHRPPKEFEDKLRGALKKSDLETLKRDFNTMKEMTTKMKEAGDKAAKKEKKVKMASSDGIENAVQPIQKPIHLRSQKPMTRVPIEDVGSVKDFDIFSEKVQTSQEKKPFRMPVVDIDESMDTSENKPSPLLEGDTQADCVKEVKTGSQSKGFCKKVEKEIALDMSRVDLGVADTPCVPKSSSRFLQDWRRLRTVVNRSKYLRQFKEEDYRVVFKNSLEGALLEEMVMVLEQLVNRGDNPEIVIRQVRGLANLPRITAVAMFMSRESQARLKEVLKEMDCLAGPGERELWNKAFSL